MAEKRTIARMMASKTYCFEENNGLVVNFANFIIDNAVPAIAALNSAFVCQKVGQFTIAKRSAIRFASFIGALKNESV